ncbi:MAG: FAD-dependent oxidoreductase [Chloroflexi bacterium]|nr:FAD-dependent oxidoreductase [Chloroflexota bacterium]
MNTIPEITVYGAYWCPDCSRSKAFLGEHQIPYNWVDIEGNPDGEAYVIQKNDGKRIIPTIEFGDGSILVEPSNAELADKLNLKTIAEKSHYDLIILGGGPAGLTAALYTAREGIDTLVVERAALGGQAATTQWLDNVPGFGEGISGADFSGQLRFQAERFGAELLQAQDVVNIHSQSNYHFVTTANGSEYSARALLITTGSKYRLLNVPGEIDYIGAGIHFCATCDGVFYKGKSVVVVGGGNSATEESLFLTKFVDEVTMLVREGELMASQILQDNALSHPKIKILFNTDVVEFRGSGGKLESILIKNNQTDEKNEIFPAGSFIFIGLTPNTAFLDDSGVRLDTGKFIVTGHDLVHGRELPAGFDGRDPAALETNIPGIFSAGDVRAASTKQVTTAAGEGATAALLVREYLKTV